MGLRLPQVTQNDSDPWSELGQLGKTPWDQLLGAYMELVESYLGEIELHMGKTESQAGKTEPRTGETVPVGKLSPKLGKLSPLLGKLSLAPRKLLFSPLLPPAFGLALSVPPGQSLLSVPDDRTMAQTKPGSSFPPPTMSDLTCAWKPY